MTTWRVFYWNGFWGDELAYTKEEAREKAKAFAASNNTTIYKIEKLHR